MPVDIRLTYEDYCLLPDDGKRYEIIDGELFVTPAPRTLHQKIVTWLAHYLSAFLLENPLGQVFVAPLDVVFSDFDVVEPDIVYVSRERASVLTEKNIQGAPDLVVEVLSETTEKRDLTLKLRLYARNGVKEYWAINPSPISGKIYRRQGDELELVATLQADDPLTSPLLPGFSLPLRKLIE
jgi:Uma2 family endonuclease